MVDPDKDKFFETSVGGDSDSDESYHSLTEGLQNVTVDQSLYSVNAADSFEFYREGQCRTGHSDQHTNPRNDPSTAGKSDADLCISEDSKDSSQVFLDNSDSHLLINSSPDSRKEETSSETKLLHDSSTTELLRDTGDVSSEAVMGPEAVVNCVADDSLDDEQEEEELDICSLDSVKTRDAELELKLKDKEVDISLEEMKSALDAAVEEKREGNVLFTRGEYREAIARYNAGLGTCPLGAPQDCAMLYHNRGVAYAKMGEHKLAVHSLTQALAHDPQYVKALARRAAENEAAEDLDDALQDYQQLLQLQPGHREAREAVHRLPPKIAERNEKLKAEMMGKLKDLGNMILKPFGMSTENFQLQQDPKSGGYNIQFKQNP